MTTVPVGAASAIDVSSASSSPAASKATSTPCPPVSARSSPRSAPPATRTAAVAPAARAASTRCGSTSVATTVVAPDARASWIRKSPIGPQPKMPTDSPGRIPASLTAWRATPSGSSIATSPSVRPSGTGMRHLPGQATSSRSEPSVAPWPAKRILRQRWTCPARHCSHSSHPMAGSIATRWPRRGPDSTTPPAS